LVAQSKGVNVWCAAGAEAFNTHSVVSAIKTSGIENRVDRRTVILPPLSAPGVNAADIRKRTGWKVKWGPVRAADIPAYLDRDCHREEREKRVTYRWDERLDTAAGSLFPFYFLGAAGFAVFSPHLLPEYLAVGAACFLLFMLACPWIPGRNGLLKVLFLEVVLAALLFWAEIGSSEEENLIRAPLIIAMVMTAIYGTELGGLAPNMKSEFDAFLGRLGVRAIGNTPFAGDVRTELLNGYRELSYDREKCLGCRNCFEVCPISVWEFDRDEKKAVPAHIEACTACRACIVQCPSGAIEAMRVKPTS
jgi:NAD-dependent dihydropyrimidine dehydrogenase PreA subunit